jgi:hypothetical protein
MLKLRFPERGLLMDMISGDISEMLRVEQGIFCAENEELLTAARLAFGTIFMSNEWNDRTPEDFPLFRDICIFILSPQSQCAFGVLHKVFIWIWEAFDRFGEEVFGPIFGCAGYQAIIDFGVQWERQIHRRMTLPKWTYLIMRGFELRCDLRHLRRHMEITTRDLDVSEYVFPTARITEDFCAELRKMLCMGVREHAHDLIALYLMLIMAVLKLDFPEKGLLMEVIFSEVSWMLKNEQGTFLKDDKELLTDARLVFGTIFMSTEWNSWTPEDFGFFRDICISILSAESQCSFKVRHQALTWIWEALDRFEDDDAGQIPAMIAGAMEECCQGIFDFVMDSGLVLPEKCLDLMIKLFSSLVAAYQNECDSCPFLLYLDSRLEEYGDGESEGSQILIERVKDWFFFQNKVNKRPVTKMSSVQDVGPWRG